MLTINNVNNMTVRKQVLNKTNLEYSLQKLNSKFYAYIIE